MPHAHEHCRAFFDELKVEPVYVPPVLKDRLNIEELTELGIVAPISTWKRRTPLPAAGKSFEIACALSHLRACHMIVQSGSNFAFVFEDDNITSPTCADRFALLVDWAKHNYKSFNVINVSPCNSLHMCNGILSGTQGCTNALLYSQQGARFVVDNILPVCSPIDDWLHLTVPNAYCVHKRIFCQSDASATGIVSILNPMFCKYERLVNVHSLFVLSVVVGGVVCICSYI